MTRTPLNILLSPNKEDAQRLTQALADWVQKHRPFFDAFLDAYCVVDLTGKVIDFNVAFTDMVGESYRKVLKIGDFSTLLNTELCPDLSPPKQIVASQKQIRIDELKASTKSFPQLQVILAGIPIFSDGGEILGSLLNIRNVSAESELQKKYDERKKESMTDGLTQLVNKVYSEEFLVKALKSSLRQVQQTSVCLVDIDHFKKINDTFGHQTGDYVLANVARILKEEVRETDIVGRFGGEEFIVILTHTPEDGAIFFAERFRKALETARIEFDGKRIYATASVGVSTFSKLWEPGMNPNDEMKTLIHNSDVALYEAKKTGRNKVVSFSKLPPTTKP